VKFSTITDKKGQSAHISEEENKEEVKAENPKD
jgi:hypothetical protein